MATYRYCKTCGAHIGPLQRPEGGYHWTDLIVVRDHKSINTKPVPGRQIEHSPQLVAAFSIHRNGGCEDDICCDCIKLAARVMRDRLDALLNF